MRRSGAAAPWRPPPASAIVAWPESFGTRFTIIVDTEEEFDWSAPFARAGHGTATAAELPAAARRFGDHGCALAYVADYPVVADPRAADALRKVLADGRSMVGAQLHPWVTPPFDEALTRANSFAGNLPPALEAAKLAALTQAIAEAFGKRPILYRAGRYGVGPNTLRLLAAEGYRLDSSMRAGYDYSGEGGPDFTGVPDAGFWTGPEDGVLELPFSTVFTGRARRWGGALHKAAGAMPRGRGALSRSGLVARVSLTPEDMPVDEVLEAIRIALGEGRRLLNFAFHSPSLAPGHTPYVRDAADLAAFWRWWDKVLGLLAQRGVAFATIDEILAAACAARARAVSPTTAGGL